MSEIDEIKRKRMEQLREQYTQQQDDIHEQLQLQQQLDAIEGIAKNYLAKEAIVRYGSLKSAHPEKAIRVAVILAQAVQAGQIKAKLSDEQFKDLLRQMEPPKSEFKMVKK